jgi:hypothetical protein
LIWWRIQQANSAEGKSPACGYPGQMRAGFRMKPAWKK